MKPNLMHSPYLPPITIQPNERYIPSAFDESLSLVQKLNKAIHYLQEYSKITEDTLTKWNEVYRWVMNEGLDETVGNRLVEWVENGTLEKIINENLLTDINNNVNEVKKLVGAIQVEVDKTVNFMYQEYYNIGATSFEWGE